MSDAGLYEHFEFARLAKREEWWNRLARLDDDGRRAEDIGIRVLV